MSDIHTMVGGYATNALSTEERRQFEEHLVDCDGCRQEVQEFRETLARLGPTHSAAPPPGVRHAVLSQISSVRVLPPYDDAPDSSDASAPDDHTGPGEPSTPRRKVWIRRSLALAAAVSVVANLLLGASVIQLQQQRDHNERVARAESQARTELMAAPDLRVHRARMEDGTAVSYLVSASQGRALMVSSAMNEPREGRTWQLWSIHDGTPTSVGLLSAGGEVHIWIDEIAGAQALAITDEPQGGSPQPTTTPQAVTKLAES